MVSDLSLLGRLLERLRGRRENGDGWSKYFRLRFIVVRDTGRSVHCLVPTVRRPLTTAAAAAVANDDERRHLSPDRRSRNGDDDGAAGTAASNNAASETVASIAKKWKLVSHLNHGTEGSCHGRFGSTTVIDQTRLLVIGLAYIDALLHHRNDKVNLFNWINWILGICSYKPHEWNAYQNCHYCYKKSVLLPFYIQFITLSHFII